MSFREMNERYVHIEVNIFPDFYVFLFIKNIYKNQNEYHLFNREKLYEFVENF